MPGVSGETFFYFILSDVADLPAKERDGKAFMLTVERVEQHTSVTDVPTVY